MLLYGSESTAAHIESVYFLDELLPDSNIPKLSGLGHMAPELGSKAVAETIAGFFTEKL